MHKDDHIRRDRELEQKMAAILFNSMHFGGMSSWGRAYLMRQLAPSSFTAPKTEAPCEREAGQAASEESRLP